jgi:hypothetical protein
MVKKILLTASLSLLTLLQADYITTYQMESGTQTFMYHDASHAKMITSEDGERSEIYRIGEKTYAVSHENGKTKVIDFDQIRAMAESLGGGSQQQLQKTSRKKEKFNIDKTGKKVTVGGIKGEVWIVEGFEKGEKFKQEVVVTKDKRVSKAMNAMMKVFADMSGGEADEMQDIFEIEKGYSVIKADGMVLKSFEEKRLSKSTYELPKDAQMQEMPNLAGLFGSGATQPQNAQGKKSVLDPCYKEVCCGKTAGDAKVLAPMLKALSGGYKLEGSGTCNALGLSTLFGIKSVEGALYAKGNDTIQVTLNLDDNSGGKVKKTREQVNSGGMSVVKSVKNYKSGVIGSHTYEYGMFMPMNQQTLDISIDSKTVLSITRIASNGEIDLISWTKRAINFDAFEKAAAEKKQEPKREKQHDDEDTSLDKEQLNKDVDEAVKMFKSLF